MSDIFISYSRRDSAQALELAERLRSSGMEVWIDQHGIEGAEQWATEIVEGIRLCSTFLVLLSPSSTESENVLKELSLASEKRKRILPVDLAPVVLPSSFEYPLAGLQRVAIGDFDAILRAHRHGVTRKIQKDERKSLIILPFEDLSPSHDNQWFADGLAGELIDALGQIKSLRILDRKTSLELRGVKQTTVEIGKLFDTRYFVEGSVRKFGEQIKISCSLLDIETGDHLWQDSHKGVMQDIFELQELVAQKVVEGLKLHLTKEEKSLLADHGTENAEAYELLVKAIEYYHRQTKEGFQHAIQLLSEALRVDPSYSQAYQLKANALISLYRSYDRKSDLLDEAEALCREARRLKPDLVAVLYPLSQIYLHRGTLTKAIEMAKEYILEDSRDFMSHFSLGMCDSDSGQYSNAISPYEEAVRLKPDNLVNLFNLLSSCDSAGAREKGAHWASVALPYFERHLKLHPDDENQRVNHALLLFWSGRNEDAHAAAMKLTHLRDGNSLYNTACLLGKLGDKSEALRALRNAIEEGFSYVRHLKDFLTDENEGIARLAGTPECEIVRQMVEKIEAEGYG